ncbi:MAG: hypothetical protein ACFCVD_10530 [Nodosilinea sp.]
MTFKLEALFDTPDHQYLDANDISLLSQYVSSIPERVTVYRTLRDQEVAIMQPVADALERSAGQSEATVERSVRNGLMVLRYVAMAMLLDHTPLVEERLQGWLPEMVKAYESQAIDQQLLQLLQQQLALVFTPAQLNLLKPGLDKARALMLDPRETVAASLAGLL